MDENYYEIPMMFEMDDLEIGKEIASVLPDDGGVLSLMRDAIAASGGKCIRARMCVEFARNLGFKGASLSGLAAAIELIHYASLLQDDIFDNDERRRNGPAFHVRWGKSASILYSDIMVSKAYKMILSINRNDIAGNIVDAVSDMCRGEILHRHRNKSGITADEYIDIVSKKTAALFRVSCQSGAMLATSRKGCIDLAAEFGFSYGVAFQLVDDCVDLEETDLKNNVTTMPQILNDPSCRKTAALAIDYIKDAEKCVMKFDEIGDFAGTDGLSYALRSLEARAIDVKSRLKTSMARY